MKLTCVHCNRPLRIRADQLGSEVACPHCRQMLRLPKAEAYRAERRPAVAAAARSWISGSISGMISFVVHMGLLLTCALVTCDYQGGGGELGEEVRIGVLPAVKLGDREEEPLDASALEAKVEQTAQPEATLEIASPVSDSAGDMALDVRLADIIPSSAAGGGGPEVGTVRGGGGALGEGASFMGVHARGTRFCIIADRSGSMEGPKLDYVKEEILETLTSMRSRGRFQLFFFNTQAAPYPQPGWRHPVQDRTEVVNWMQTIHAGGGTYPTPAFRQALELSPRPDAIFFMTDGLFPEDVVKEVADLNRRGGKKVTIHTISFMDTSAENLLRQIANDSGGRYRHVSGF